MIFVKVFFFSILGVFTSLFGDFTPFFTSVLILFGIHFLLTFFYDIKMKDVSFQKILFRCFKGFSYLSFIAVSVILDHLMGFDDSFRMIVLSFILYHEISMIIKICSLFGIFIPDFFVETLKKITDSLPNGNSNNKKS